MCGTSSSDLTLTDKSSSGCACCAPKDPASKDTAAPTVPTVTGDVTASFKVTGLTCGSCASRVTSAVSALEDVTAVRVDLVAGGTSTVTVRSNQPVPPAEVRSAVEQAGYQLTNA